MSARRLALPALAAAALSVAGCGGGSSPAAGNDNPVVAPAGTATTSAAATTPTTSASASRAPVGASTGAAPAATRSAAAGTAPAPAGTSTAAQPAPGGYPQTPAGTYTYAETGTTSGTLGSHQVNQTSSYRVDPPAGNTQHSTQTADEGGQSSTQEQTVVDTAGGLLLADIKITSSAFNEDFHPAKPVLFFPKPATAGQQWHWTITSTDGKYTLTGAFTLKGTATQRTGAGQSLATTEVDTVLHITGSQFDLTVNQQDWVDTANMLIVKEHAVTSGKAYGYTLDSDITRTLESTHPA